MGVYKRIIREIIKCLLDQQIKKNIKRTIEMICRINVLFSVFLTNRKIFFMLHVQTDLSIEEKGNELMR